MWQCHCLLPSTPKIFSTPTYILLFLYTLVIIGRENAVASTKAFTTQVTSLALIALWFRQTRDMLNGKTQPSLESIRLKEALMRLPITFGMVIQSRAQCKKIAERLVKKEHCFVLGKGKLHLFDFAVMYPPCVPLITESFGLVSINYHRLW